MVILKKVRASTLVETLIASVIIVVVFVIASLSLNSIFKGVVEKNDTSLLNRTKELMYLTKHDKIQIPYYEDTSQWEITIEKRNSIIVLESFHKASSTSKEEILQYEILP